MLLRAYQRLKNRVDFGLRSWLKPNKGLLSVEKLLGKLPERLSDWDEARLNEEEARLKRLYLLDVLDFASWGGLQQKETLQTLLQLEALFSLTPENLSIMRKNTLQAPLRWLDVGSKNWLYAPALLAYAQTLSSNTTLMGVELDGYRQYQNGYTRQNYAQSVIKPLMDKGFDLTYQVANVQTVTGQWEVISWLLPFVFEDPHLAWGLPKYTFQPQKALAQVVSLLAPGGILIITNLNEEEATQQQRLLAAHANELEIIAVGPLPEAFLPYPETRRGFVCLKKP